MDTEVVDIADLDATAARPLPARVASLVRGRRGVIVEGGGLHLLELPPPASIPDGVSIHGEVGPLYHPSWDSVLLREEWRSLWFDMSHPRQCGIDTTGRVLCSDHGRASEDAELIVLDAGPVSQIGSSFGTVCTLDDAGRVACPWASREWIGDPAVLQGLPAAVDIAVSGMHACIVTVEDATLCWGSELTAQLGDGVLEYRGGSQPPRQARVPPGAHAVATGGGTTCAVVRQRVWCWGYSSWGQAGAGDYQCTHGVDRTRPCQFSPVEIELPAPATDVVVTGVTSCATLEDGDLWCWGVVPGPEYPARPSRTAVRNCWISPRPVLRGVAGAVASQAGEICAFDVDASRVACFGGSGEVAAPTIVFRRDDG